MSIVLTAALAAALGAPAAPGDITLSKTEVTAATRRAQTVDETLASVTVITRDEIEASAAIDVVELLRRVPGVDVARTGGFGQNVAVFMRGTNSNHVLVLVDGVRVASSNTGAFAFEHLMLEQVERIEVVRGPRASYYGSDAIGGVIAITTRRQTGPEASIHAGRYQAFGGSAGYGAAGDRGDFGFTAGGESFAGYSAATPSNFSYDPDRDGYHHRNVSAHGRLRLGEHVVGANAFGVDADVDFDQGTSALRTTTVGASASGPIADGWTYAVTLGGARETLRTPAFGNRFETRRQNLDAIADWGFAPDQHLLFGVNYQREHGDNIDTFSGEPAYGESRHTDAAFASWQGHVMPWDWEVAVRYDDNSSYGSETTGQAAAGFTFATDWRVFASYGEGYRAPTLNELYSPGFGGLFAGNPLLDAETSHSTEAGLEWRHGVHAASVRAFRTIVDDLIAFEGGETFQAINVQRARIDGVEVEYATTLAQWRLEANATLQDAENRSTGTDLLRRPKRKAGVGASRTFASGVSVGATVDYASLRRDFGGSRLAPYTLVALHAGLPLSPDWSLGLRLENAGGRDYALAEGYATPGRSLLATLRWAPRD